MNGTMGHQTMFYDENMNLLQAKDYRHILIVRMPGKDIEELISIQRGEWGVEA